MWVSGGLFMRAPFDRRLKGVDTFEAVKARASGRLAVTTDAL